jgi:putative ABC transport system permease protein
VVRAYRALLGLLPRAVREQDGDEMTRTFASMWARAGSAPARLALIARSVLGVLGVAAAEWREQLLGRGNVSAAADAPPLAAPARALLSGDALVRTFRHAARSVRRTPAFALTTITLLGLGVGAVTTIFTVTDHVLLRPLRYPDADRLVEVTNGSHSGPMLRDFGGIRSVEAWAAVSSSWGTLTGDGPPERAREARVTETFFDFFGAEAAVGRLFLPEDFTAAEAVVLSWTFWQRALGGDPSVVGRSIQLDGRASPVVGVLARDFDAPEAMLDQTGTDVWRPIDRADPGLADRSYQNWSVAGRLAPGATIEQASSEAAALAERLAADFPDNYRRRDGTVRRLPVISLQESTVGDAGNGLHLLLGAVLLLLLVACANVAHLFMARGLDRSREMSLRRALGAGRRSIVGQLLAESLLIGAGGALLGIALAAGGLRAFVALAPALLPRTAEISIDYRALGCALGLAALTSVVFGLFPALRTSGRDPGQMLASKARGATGSRTTRQVQSGLVVAEVALSVVLMVGAGLLLRSFTSLRGEELGFRVDDVWTVPLVPERTEIVAESRARMDAVRSALATVPGVRAATYAIELPLQYTGGGTCCWSTNLRRPDAEARVSTKMHPVAGGYFDVFAQRVLAGRVWSSEEADGTPVRVVANQALAEELFGTAEAAVGEEVLQGTATRYQLVGVVAEDRHYGIDQEHGAALYLPIQAIPFSLFEAHMAVLTEDPPPNLASLLRQAVWSVEPNVAVPTVRTMASWRSLATAGSRFDSVLFTTFGVVALLLAAGGLYGTLLYAVGRERREIGIRLALGAERGAIVMRVVSRGLGLAAVGSVVGAVGAWASGRLLASRLYGVEPGDAVTLVGALAVLLTTAAVAAWLPARRAAATDPVETLRQD